MTDPRAAAPSDPLPGAAARFCEITKDRGHRGARVRSPGWVPPVAAIRDRAAAA